MGLLALYYGFFGKGPSVRVATGTTRGNRAKYYKEPVVIATFHEAAGTYTVLEQLVDGSDAWLLCWLDKLSSRVAVKVTGGANVAWLREVDSRDLDPETRSPGSHHRP